jgi:23S rRNA (cytosine1962-C5)-methyltransferase
LRAIALGGREASREVIVLRMLGQPPDHPVPAAFPEGRYLKVVLARVP